MAYAARPHFPITSGIATFPPWDKHACHFSSPYILETTAMKHLFALFVGGLVSLSPALADAPCDFKGVSVGSKMSPAEIMSALGVAQYKMNPARWSFDKKNGACG